MGAGDGLEGDENENEEMSRYEWVVMVIDGN